MERSFCGKHWALLGALTLSAFGVIAVGVGPAEAKEAPVRPLLAGAAMTDITPALGVSLAGYMNDRKAAYIHDELHARCLMLDDGTTRIAIVLVDNCLIPRSITDEAKRLTNQAIALPVDHLLIAATHSHTAACVTPVFQSDPDPEYCRFLTVRIADAVRLAAAHLEPAEIAWGVGQVPDEVHCRRWKMKAGTVPPDPFGHTTDQVRMNPPVGSSDLIEPAGPTDPEVSFIAVRACGVGSHAARPIALFANYSLHYVGGEGGAGHVSADYFACFAERITELLNADHLEPPFVGIMSNGTSGNINNIDFQHKRPAKKPYEQMRFVADKVAKEVYRVSLDLKWHAIVSLDAMQEEIELGVRKPTTDEVAEAKARLARLGGAPLQAMPDIYARETVLMADYPATVKIIVQALRIGEVGIAAIPCEVFSETGLALKHESPMKPTFTVELANGYNGYLPTREQHALGGYETWRGRSSYLAVDADERIRAAALELLQRIRK